MRTEETCNGKEKMHSKHNTAPTVRYHFLPPHSSLPPDNQRGVHNSNGVVDVRLFHNLQLSCIPVDKDLRNVLDIDC